MSARWPRIAIVVAAIGGAAVAGRAIDVAVVSAQPAMAIGQPLPDPKLEARTVMVRVIAGNRDKPETGVDVTLAIIPPTGGDTVSRVARTDAEGRASFVDLPSGAIVTATVSGPGGPQSSSAFPVPATGGTRVLLSTVPMSGAPTTSAGPGSPAGPGGAGAGSAGGPVAGGQPQPRAMSGRPRAQPGDPADTLTVRVSHDDLVDARPPQDQPVVLVAYKYDHSVTAKVVKTDPAGRAVFAGLDRTGATSYFALTTLARDAVHDRLTTGPLQLVADDGLRLILSGEKLGSDKPVADDLTNLSPQPPQPVAPGTVEVIIAGVPEDGAPVEVVEAVSGQVVATAKAGPPMAASGTAEARWQAPTEEPTLAPGTVEVTVTIDGTPGIPLTVEVRPRAAAAPATPIAPAGARAPVRPGGSATPPAQAAAAPLTAQTARDGKATITGLTPGAPADLAIVTPAGTTIATTITPPVRGGARVRVDVTWKERGQASARLTGVTGAADRAFFVRTRMHGQLNLSAPFQLTPERGAMMNVVAMPRVMLSFSLTSWVDDRFLVFTGQWTISNSSWAPYLPTKDYRPTELVVPLPSAATGIQVRDDFASMVGTDPARGFVIRRPLPPGGLEFFAGFSTTVQDGAVRWDMPLPYGSFESGIEILRPNGTTKVVVPTGTKVSIESAEDRRGKFWVMSPITILPPQRMVFEVRGLPQPPSWTRWSEVVVGVVALVILIGGIGLALHRGSAAAARESLRGRYDRLLDELARLESAGGDAGRRAELRAELEALRERLDQAEPAGTGA